MRKFPLFLFLFIINIYGGFLPGNAFKAFFWFMSEEDSLKHGCYGYIYIDSVSSSENEDIYHTSFWLTYDWWFLIFKGSYTPTNIILKKNKPDAISRGSNHFLNIEWFSGFYLANSNDSLIFYFPLINMQFEYGRYDYFTVDVDTLLDLEFYGAGDSIMVGTFTHKKPSPSGSVNILGRNAFIIELTKSNPLRIKSIRCNGEFDSLLFLFLKFPLDTFKTDACWYGVDILDTLSNIPMIAIDSLRIDGQEPYLIGSNKDIKWSLRNKEGIDSCLISITYDSFNWIPLSNTELDSSFMWTVGNDASEATIIKVMACGKHGERIYSVLDNMQFFAFKIRYLQILRD